MFTTITAKFPSACKRCGGAINVGDTIRYGGRGRTYHLKADCATGSGENGDTQQQRVYSASGGAAGRSAFGDDAPDIIETRFSSGATIYRNKRGRCEDAPCCGCCT